MRIRAEKEFFCTKRRTIITLFVLIVGKRLTLRLKKKLRSNNSSTFTILKFWNVLFVKSVCFDSYNIPMYITPLISLNLEFGIFDVFNLVRFVRWHKIFDFYIMLDHWSSWCICGETPFKFWWTVRSSLSTTLTQTWHDELTSFQVFGSIAYGYRSTQSINVQIIDTTRSSSSFLVSTPLWLKIHSLCLCHSPRLGPSSFHFLVFSVKTSSYLTLSP